MTTYHAPVEDYRFILNELLCLQERDDLAGSDALTPETCQQILEGAARFHEDVLFPVGAHGDAEGARLVEGQVRTPAVYRDAWEAYRRSGWLALGLPESIGGAGLPAVLAAAVAEMRVSAAQSLHMYFGFCAPVARMLHELGEPWMRERVAPKLAAGEWSATMCMTESHCGSDIRQIRTRARPRADGSWLIDGTKIFISGGDHDLAGNIMHIVLAKVPDETGAIGSGLSPVSVFLVPKFDVDPQTGDSGSANNVFVDAIEKKMGLEGNATCVLRFERARAWRISAPAGAAGGASNMAPMFMLMNHARVGTALTGVAYAELAAQNATAYARSRLAGRAATGARHPGLPGDPIAVHPDIRRLLLGARAFAEGGRATAMRALVWQAEAETGGNASRRSIARDLLELATPVMKAYFTDQGFAAANDCLQVLGGHGYMREYGLEQMVRNVRASQIYEGANGIQAIDLVQRRLPARGWQPARSLVDEFRSSARGLAENKVSPVFVTALQTAADDLEAVFALLERRSTLEGAGVNLAVASDTLEMCGIALVGWNWATAAAAAETSQMLSPSMRRRKLACAHFWMEREMPKLSMLRRRVAGGLSTVLTMDDSDL